MLLRLGGQVHIRKAFPAAVAALRCAERREGAPLPAMTGPARARALEAARDALRDQYRRRWTEPHQRRVLARVSSVMVCGAADIDDVGVPPAGCSPWCVPDDPTLKFGHPGPSVTPLLCALARQVFREYQRALWDPNPLTPAEPGEWHVQQWGGVAMFVADEQTNRLPDGGFQRHRPPWCARQWQALQRALDNPCTKTLCVATETPPVTHSPHVLAAGPRTATALMSWEGHSDDAVRLYGMLWAWKQAQPGREAVVVCGSTTCGVSTVLRSRRRGEPGALRQLCVGPINNAVAPFAAAARGVLPIGEADVGAHPSSALLFTHNVVLPARSVGMVQLTVAARKHLSDAVAVPAAGHPGFDVPVSGAGSLIKRTGTEPAWRVAPSRGGTPSASMPGSPMHSRPPSSAAPFQRRLRTPLLPVSADAVAVSLTTSLSVPGPGPQPAPPAPPTAMSAPGVVRDVPLVNHPDGFAIDCALAAWLCEAKPGFAHVLAPYTRRPPQWVADSLAVVGTCAAASTAHAAAVALLDADCHRKSLNKLAPPPFNVAAQRVFDVYSTGDPATVAPEALLEALNVLYHRHLAPSVRAQLLPPSEQVCRWAVAGADNLSFDAFLRLVRHVLAHGMALQAACLADLTVFRDDDT